MKTLIEHLKENNISFTIEHNPITFTEFVEIFHNNNLIFQFSTNTTITEFKEVLNYLKQNYNETQAFSKFKFWAFPSWIIEKAKYATK